MCRLPPLVLDLPEALGALWPLLCQLRNRSWPMPAEPHPWVELEAQREVGVRSLQIPVDQTVDLSLQVGGIILMNLGDLGWWAIRRYIKKNGVRWC